MYIYNRKLSDVQPLLEDQSVTSTSVQRNIYYPDRSVSGFTSRGGNSGSYVWANEGVGELSDGKFKSYPAGKCYGSLKK